MVGFLLGCSDSFETALLNAGVSLRLIEENKIAPIYETNPPCAPVHIGVPSTTGINDPVDTRYGTDRMTIGPDETSLFRACALTALAAALTAEIDFMITCKPGRLFITGQLTEEVR